MLRQKPNHSFLRRRPKTAKLLEAAERLAALDGETLLLADIMRDAYKVISVIEADDSDEDESLQDLKIKMSYALAMYDPPGGVPL